MNNQEKTPIPLDTVSEYNWIDLFDMKPLELRGQDDEKERQFQEEMRRG